MLDYMNTFLETDVTKIKFREDRQTNHSKQTTFFKEF